MWGDGGECVRRIEGHTAADLWSMTKEGSILAAQPLQELQKECPLEKGVALRLTKSSVTGVSLIHFDMELTGGRTGGDPAVMPADMFLDPDSEFTTACGQTMGGCVAACTRGLPLE